MTYWLVPIVAGVLIWLVERVIYLERQVQRLHQLLGAVDGNSPDGAGKTGDEALNRRVGEMVAAGEMIQAIQLLRNSTGMGLQEAYHTVTRIKEEQDGACPEEASPR